MRCCCVAPVAALAFVLTLRAVLSEASLALLLLLEVDVGLLPLPLVLGP